MGEEGGDLPLLNILGSGGPEARVGACSGDKRRASVEVLPGAACSSSVLDAVKESISHYTLHRTAAGSGAGATSTGAGAGVARAFPAAVAAVEITNAAVAPFAAAEVGGAATVLGRGEAYR